MNFVRMTRVVLEDKKKNVSISEMCLVHGHTSLKRVRNILLLHQETHFKMMNYSASIFGWMSVTNRVYTKCTSTSSTTNSKATAS